MADEAAQNLVKVYSGPLTERPSAGVDGRFWVTDTGAVYEDDGSTWSLVDREYKSVSTERVHSDKFGGVDDYVRVLVNPTGTEIQSAIDGFPSPRLRQCVLRIIGEVTTNAAITVPSWTFLDLSNASIKVGSAFPNSTAVFTTEEQSEQCTFFGGFLDGQKSQHSVSGHRGIELNGVKDRDATPGVVKDNRHRILFTQFQEFPSMAVHNRARRSHQLGLTAAYCGDPAFRVNSSDQTWINCGVNDNSGRGFDVMNSHNEFRHCYAHNCANVGVDFRYLAKWNIWDGGYSEINDLQGILIQSGTSVHSNTVKNCELIDNGRNASEAAVTVETEDNVIRDNWIYDTALATPQGDAVVLTASSTGNRVFGNDVSRNPTGITDNGSSNVVDGIGAESASAETPTAANWSPGDIVDFTDLGDGSGTGQYLLLRDGTTWAQIG